MLLNSLSVTDIFDYDIALASILEVNCEPITKI
jgi:hypothetical protein